MSRLPKHNMPIPAFRTVLPWALLAIASLANADSTLTYKLDVQPVDKGDPAPSTPAPGVYTVRYRGALARAEGPDGVIRLIDYEHAKVTTLNSLLKSYYVQTRKEFLVDSSAGGLEVHTSTDFKEQPGADAVFASLNGALYHLRATSTIEAPTRPAGRSGGMGRRRGGGFPGGGIPGGGIPGGGIPGGAGSGDPAQAPPVPGLPGLSGLAAWPRIYEADCWMTSEASLNLPAKADDLPILSCLVAQGSVLNSLEEAMHRIRIGPLMVSLLMPPTREERAFRLTAELQAVDKADLTDDQFLVPPGYTKVDAPKPLKAPGIRSG